MDRIQEKYFDRIIEAYKKENSQANNQFDLFAALNEASNEEAFIYRGGYYIVNKYCNRNLDLKVTDTFYSIYLGALIKFDVMKLGSIEFFEVYKLKDLTGEQIRGIEHRINNVEDIRKEQVERILRDLSV